MAAATTPHCSYVKLLYDPPSTARNDNPKVIPNMMFDEQHYERSYWQCRGSGRSHSDCMYIPEDSWITPQNPALNVFKKELVDAVECMAVLGDEKRCQHFIEGFHKLTHYEAPGKGNVDKGIEFLSKLLKKSSKQ